MKRKVIQVRNYIDKHANGTKGSNVLLLDCGHHKSQIGSIKIPKYAFCRQCRQLASGLTYGSSWNDVIFETWDSVNKRPVFTDRTNPNHPVILDSEPL